MNDQAVKATEITTARRCVRCSAENVSSAVGVRSRDFHQNTTRTALMTVNRLGTIKVSHAGATDMCVAAKAQVLDIKMKYITGICLQNARYFAFSSSGL